MQRFLITYDLRGGTEEDYEELTKALKGIGADRLQESVWAWYLPDASDTPNCTDLRDLFWTHMRDADRLLVVRFDDWSGRNGLARIPES